MSAVIRTVQAHPFAQRVLAAIGSRTVRIGATILLIGFGLSQIPLRDVVGRLEGASVPLAAAGVLLLLLGQVLSGYRWHALAVHLDLRESPRWFVAAYLRGCFYNSVLPTGIGGDAMRIASARPMGTWRSATRSVVIDRVTGLLALALAAGALLPVAGLGLPAGLAWAAATVSVAAFVAIVAIAARRRLLGWLSWTIAYELVWFTGVWALARALSVHLAWATPAVVLIVGIAMALPISFGGHGAREAGFVLALAPLGVAADSAVALGVLFGCALALVGLSGALVPVPPARPAADPGLEPYAPESEARARVMAMSAGGHA